jgi:hypothetical protein
LGREIILTKEEELVEELTDDWNSPEMTSPQPKESLKIRVWKMASFPTATIPYIEAQMSQPTGSLKYDEVDSHESRFQLSQRYYDSTIEGEEGSEERTDGDHPKPFDFNCREYFTVKWKVSYLLDIKANVTLTFPYLISSPQQLLIRGEVDISSLPCSPARIGLQLNLCQDFNHCCWFGNGPHENYQVLVINSSFVFTRTVRIAKLQLFVPFTLPHAPHFMFHILFLVKMADDPIHNGLNSSHPRNSISPLSECCQRFKSVATHSAPSALNDIPRRTSRSHFTLQNSDLLFVIPFV